VRLAEGGLRGQRGIRVAPKEPGLMIDASTNLDGHGVAIRNAGSLRTL
jgi:hypothetical protein